METIEEIEEYKNAMLSGLDKKIREFYNITVRLTQTMNGIKEINNAKNKEDIHRVDECQCEYRLYCREN